MNPITTIVCVSTLATGLCAQEGRRPVDLSVQGMEELPRSRDTRLSFPPSIGMVIELFCFPRIEDQDAAGCLMASSVPVSGMLFPYPGINNTFAGPAFVGGGQNNIASGNFSTVGAGESNTASGNFATIAGGVSNDASGYRATVGGGREHSASGSIATIAGGLENSASRLGATVGGGWLNVASGNFATTPGGLSNTAQGYYTFAAGRRAKANHDGSFVWGDAQDLDKTSSVADEFSVYCSGGARFFSNSAATSGVLLAAGGGSWTSVSDRDAKENIEPVDARAVLEEVVALPLSTWNYKEQSDTIRHMGPMAQDFYGAFGLGLGDRTIDTIDPDGVALAAIQGLNAKLEERLDEKEAEITALRDRLERLEALVASRAK